MSTYSNPAHYTYPQPSHSYQAPAYVAPSYPQYQHHSPPSQPDPYTMSPEAFRQWFMGQLAHVVVNQKNIIHHIAFIAKEHAQRMAPVIASCIEHHIRRANPQVKLPPWYLLDSIAKNIGPPYTHLFSSFVSPLFLESYHAVDVSTRSKMEEMLVTWRTGAPGGRELFGPENQNYIEKTVWHGGVSVRALRYHPYGRKRTHMSPTYSTFGHKQPSTSASRGPNKAQVLTELDVILTQKNRAVELDPYDTLALGHVQTLTQLRSLVQNSQVTSDELQAIATQLRNLARSTASAAPPLGAIPPPMPAPQTLSYQYQQPSATQHSAAPTVYSAGYTAQATMPANTYLSSNLSSAPFGVQPSNSAVPSAAALSSLFSNLVKAGVVAAPASSTMSASSMPALSSLSALLATSGAKLEFKEASRPHDVDRELAAEKEYERTVMALELSMTSMGVQREDPSVVSLLYDQLPLQCKQCAQRFPDDSAAGVGLAKKRFEDHLDMHFKQNLRNVSASNSLTGAGTLGRGFTRSWFIGKQDWITDITTDPAVTDGNPRAKGRASSPSASTSKDSKAVSEERMAQLRSSFVVIPHGDEAQPKRCPICKEVVKTEFLDEEEEWIWRNALVVKAKVYHATCHAETLSSSVAQRKIIEASTRGRSGSATPPRSPASMKLELGTEPHLTMRPSPLASLKRKAEELEALDGDSSSSSSESSTPSSQSSEAVSREIVVKKEEELSPPLKKIALGP